MPVQVSDQDPSLLIPKTNMVGVSPHLMIGKAPAMDDNCEHLLLVRGSGMLGGLSPTLMGAHFAPRHGMSLDEECVGDNTMEPPVLMAG